MHDCHTSFTQPNPEACYIRIMSFGESTSTKAIIGLLGGPISGAYYGYHYAQNKNALAVEEGRAPNSSAFLHSVVGLIFSPLSGVYYGIQCAEQEAKLKDLQEFNAPGKMRAAQNAAIEPAQGHQQTRWQDRVGAERAATSELHR